MRFLIFFFIPHHDPRNTQENHYLAEFYKESVKLWYEICNIED